MYIGVCIYMCVYFKPVLALLGPYGPVGAASLRALGLL